MVLNDINKIIQENNRGEHTKRFCNIMYGMMGFLPASRDVKNMTPIAEYCFMISSTIRMRFDPRYRLRRNRWRVDSFSFDLVEPPKPKKKKKKKQLHFDFKSAERKIMERSGGRPPQASST